MNFFLDRVLTFWNKQGQISYSFRFCGYLKSLYNDKVKSLIFAHVFLFYFKFIRSIKMRQDEFASS